MYLRRFRAGLAFATLAYARAAAADDAPAEPNTEPKAPAAADAKAVPPAIVADPKPEGDAAAVRGSLVVWPVLSPAGDDASATPVHRPRESETQLFVRAQELEATLRDAAQDLGYDLDVGDLGPATGRTRDLDLLERAAQGGARGTLQRGTWVVSPRLEYAGQGSYVVRIIVAPPGARTLRVRVERVGATDISARGLVMMRELLVVARKAQGIEVRPDLDRDSAKHGVMATPRSPGRAVLAANGTLFGAFVGYGVQRASGSDDPRLLYPLVAIGAGAGLGTSLLAAGEWDITSGDAWMLSGAAWWGTASGLLIAGGRHVQPITDRYAWGIGGGLVGASLATFALTRKRMDEGDATFTNSAGAFGLFLGSLGDFYYRGTIEARPLTGMGYGAAAGTVIAGASSLFFRASSSRVLLIDLGAGLGALGGAALSSPLLFEDVTAAKTRGFLAATTVGTLGGASIAYLLTRGHDEPVKAAHAGPLRWQPYLTPAPSTDGSLSPSGVTGGVNGQF